MLISHFNSDYVILKISLHIIIVFVYSVVVNIESGNLYVGKNITRCRKTTSEFNFICKFNAYTL